MLRRLLPILFFMLCHTAILQAGSSIGLGYTAFSKDTLYFGDTLFLQTSIINFNNSPYNELVNFGLKINGVENVNRNMFPNPLYDSLINIPATDSVPAGIYVIITSAYFEVGPDILVVWPKANDGSPPSSFTTKEIFVLDPLGISTMPTQLNLDVFYFDKSIFIKGATPEIHLNRVRIFDLSGQILYDGEVRTGQIPFNAPADGIYFIEVKFNSDQRRIFRIVKI